MIPIRVPMFGFSWSLRQAFQKFCEEALFNDHDPCLGFRAPFVSWASGVGCIGFRGVVTVFQA